MPRKSLKSKRSKTKVHHGSKKPQSAQAYTGNWEVPGLMGIWVLGSRRSQKLGLISKERFGLGQVPAPPSGASAISEPRNRNATNAALCFDQSEIPTQQIS